MTREEFQKMVDEITGGEYVRPVRKNSAKGIEGHTGFYGPTTVIKKEWMTGGAWGGNCWGDRSPSSYCPDPDPEPEMTEIDDILAKISPNITFIQYKNLMRKVTYNTRTEYEYYGNHTSYASKTITVNDLWNFLTENNLV